MSHLLMVRNSDFAEALAILAKANGHPGRFTLRPTLVEGSRMSAIYVEAPMSWASRHLPEWRKAIYRAEEALRAPNGGIDACFSRLVRAGVI